MVKRTKLEIYAYTNYGTILDFSKAIRISYVTIWNWINKRARPSKLNAEMIERFTKGELSVDYLRNNLV